MTNPEDIVHNMLGGYHKYETCYKCGKKKIAIVNREPESLLKMVRITYGRHQGQYRCKNCKED